MTPPPPAPTAPEDGLAARIWSVGDLTDRIKAVLDAIAGGQFSEEEPGRYRALVDSLLWGGDRYMLLADFDSYVAAQARVDALYNDPQAWARKAIANVSGMGFFSSDRTIREYAHQVWGLAAKA